MTCDHCGQEVAADDPAPTSIYNGFGDVPGWFGHSQCLSPWLDTGATIPFVGKRD